MKLALTGTPGTGKSTVADALADHGWTPVDLGDLAVNRGLARREDPDRPGTVVVDPGDVADALDDVLEEKEGEVVLHAHWAHDLPDVDAVAVLRCAPSTLEDRLRDRGWDQEKIHENAEAEALGVVAAECRDLPQAFELDTTEGTVDETVERLEEALADPAQRHAPGTIDWIARDPDWF